MPAIWILAVHRDPFWQLLDDLPRLLKDEPAIGIIVLVVLAAGTLVYFLRPRGESPEAHRKRVLKEVQELTEQGENVTVCPFCQGGGKVRSTNRRWGLSPDDRYIPCRRCSGIGYTRDVPIEPIVEKDTEGPQEEEEAPRDHSLFKTPEN